jgi:S1-C subfamily serine protease
VPEVGEEIHQFGAPVFRAAVLQSGKIARADTAFEFYSDFSDYVEIFHVSAMMQAGTSGGPWLNQRGEVVGLQSGLMSLEGRPIGLAYLAPAPAIRALLDFPRTTATPTLGLAADHLWESSPEFLQKLPARTEGLVVSRINQGGPAARAGLKPKDVLLAAEAKPLLRISELLRLVRTRKPGDSLTLTVLHPDTGSTNNCSLMLGCLEKDWVDPKQGN